MAEDKRLGNYTQGYSRQTLSSHLLRTAETDAAFLLPHIKKQDQVLDVGCGPGTITTGFIKYASEGRVVGIDISVDVLNKAKSLAAEANVPTTGRGAIVFEKGDVASGLPYPDNTFDVIYCGQVLGYFVQPPDLPVRALAEMRRVLKPGGILATRTGAEQHFYPRSLDLDRLWVYNFERAIYRVRYLLQTRLESVCLRCFVEPDSTLMVERSVSVLGPRYIRPQKPGSGWLSVGPASYSLEMPCTKAG